jgi:integrase
MNLKINTLNKKDVIDGNLWGVDEIIFNPTSKLLMVRNLKTKVILGFTFHSDIFDQEVIDQFHQNLLDHYQIDQTIELLSKKDFDIQEKIKFLVTLQLIQKDSRALRKWRKNVPKSFKMMSHIQKSKNDEFRRLLFESEYFHQNRLKAVSNAISEYNQTEEIQKTESGLRKRLISQVEVEEKIVQMAIMVRDSQTETQDLLQRGFTGIAFQNQELLEQNQQLREELESLKDQLKFISQQLHEKLEQERLMEEKRSRWKNRKRLPKREPITKEIYDFLISEANALSYSNSFRGARLRLALALMAVTGVRISELLSLRIFQVKTLFQKSWIAIDRKKRGPANYKAFLTKEGIQIVKDRFKDFEIISHFKEDNSYIFTSENSDKSLDREAFNRVVNLFIRDCCEKLENKPKLRSHSFRVGFITQLWKDTNDIEFVRQAIGHAALDTTSQYVKNLSEEEQQKRMLQINLNGANIL